MAWGYVGKGTGVAGNNVASLAPGYPSSGLTTGDLLVALAYSRDGSLRTPDLPSGWNEAARYDGGATRGEIAVFFRIYPGSGTSVTINFSGAGGTGVSEMAQVIGFSGNNQTQASVLGDVGADSNWAAAQNIGAITAITLTNNNQLLLVIAGRQQDMGTNGISTVVSTLSGDSQTWVEIEERGTTLGTDAGYVWDYAFTSGTPSITNKTFTNADTQTAAGCGMMVAFKIAPTGYSLNCDPGSYSVNGVSMTPIAGRIISANLGGYSITGFDASPVAGRVINADPGNYGLTGVASSVVAGRVIVASPATYDMIGFDATLDYITTGYVLNADPGVYDLTGVNAGLIADRILNVEPGVYVITGPDAAIVAQRMLSLDPGSMLLTGSDITTVLDHVLVADPGGYTIIG